MNVCPRVSAFCRKKKKMLDTRQIFLTKYPVPRKNNCAKVVSANEIVDFSFGFDKLLCNYKHDPSVGPIVSATNCQQLKSQIPVKQMHWWLGTRPKSQNLIWTRTVNETKKKAQKAKRLRVFLLTAKCQLRFVRLELQLEKKLNITVTTKNRSRYDDTRYSSR